MRNPRAATVVAAITTVLAAVRNLALAAVTAVALATAMTGAQLTAGMVATVGRSNRFCIVGITGIVVIPVVPQ